MKWGRLVSSLFKAISRHRSFKVLAVLLTVLLFFGSHATAQADASTWAALQEAIDQAENNAVLTLTNDVTALPEDSRLTIATDKCVTLDLNGHALNRNLPEYRAINGSALYVQKDAILTIRNSGGEGGVITDGYHDTGGGILNNGTLILEGGSVTGNTALDAGGGIANYGTMILMGGSVMGNTSLGYGGGVYNQAKAHMTLYGDIVFGNSAQRQQDIVNEGMLSIVGNHRDEEVRKDMAILKNYIVQITVFPAVATLLALLLAVRLDTYLSRARKRSMTVIIALVFGVILQNCLEYRLTMLQGNNAARVLLSVFGYVVHPVILAMFLSVVKSGGRYRAAWVLVGVNGGIYLTAFFSPMTFWYTVNGHFKSGPLRHTCTIVSVVLFIWLIVLTMRQFHPQKKRESWLPVLVTLLIAGAVAMDCTVIFDEQPLSFLTIAIVISCVFYYIWLHLQFVREHEDDLKAKQRIQIMRTQIQPHFLYNTIATIKVLCRKNPEQAAEVADKFGAYLRQNLNSLDMPGRIPFEKELQHTKLYAEIEMVRFGNIRVEYDIEDSDFTLPPLTLQPMVENAIRHGVRVREQGVVQVHTSKTVSGHQIVIRDNGIGFDLKEAPSQPGQHLGIQNVRERIESMCGGTLTIESTEGAGTVVTITIPDGGETR